MDSKNYYFNYIGKYTVVNKVNVDTGEFNTIVAPEGNRGVIMNYTDYYEFEKFYISTLIDVSYSKNMEYLDRNYIKQLFLSGDSHQIDTYHRRYDGKWIKISIMPDNDFSDHNPYVVYAVKDCAEEISYMTGAAISRDILQKMFVFVALIDRDNDDIEVLHKDKPIVEMGHQSLSSFIEILRQSVYEEDFPVIEALINLPSPSNNTMVEREYRAEDFEGRVHFVSAFSTYVSIPEGGRVLLLIRNVDEREANRIHMSLITKQFDMTRNMLYALGDAYYGLYYCNIDTDEMIVARDEQRTSKEIRERLPFRSYLDHYCKNFIYPSDREYMEEFFNVDEIRHSLTNNGQSIYAEYRRLFNDKYKWVRSEIQAIYCKDNQVIELVMAFKDIDDEKMFQIEHEKSLELAKKNAEEANNAKTRFFANMSHDIRTPMNAIMGLTTIALNKIDNTERVRDCLEKIDAAADNLLEIINEVLDMSAIESGKLPLKEELTSVQDILDAVLLTANEQAKKKNQQLIVASENVSNVSVYCDKTKIVRLITNLVTNAIKYTDEGGMIEITPIKYQYIDKETVIGGFIVKDNGHGMSESFVKRMYDPFSRDDLNGETGNGLGLAIARKMVDLLNGTIDVSSELGVGTQFTIKLPFRLAEIINEHVRLDDKPVFYDFTGKTVLVVDDNEINADIAQDFMEDVGAKVIVRHNGKEAVEEVAANNEIDIVLMDVRMPIMDGYQATKLIREKGLDIPIIALTANAFSEDIRKAKEIGVNAYVPKPIDSNELYSKVNKILSHIDENNAL